MNFWLGFAAATTLILGAAYTLWMYKRVIFGAVANDHVAELTDLNRREFWLLAAVALRGAGDGRLAEAVHRRDARLGRGPAAPRRAGASSERMRDDTSTSSAVLPEIVAALTARALILLVDLFVPTRGATSATG